MADEKPSYVRELLASQGNLNAGLGALAVAAILSIPFGFGIGAIPLLAFAAGEIIAALYVPSSIKFRDDVDRKWRARERAATRQRLLAEIDARARPTSFHQQTMNAYARMASRVASLYNRADGKNYSGTLTVKDKNALDLSGCVAVVLCRTTNWTRIK